MFGQAALAGATQVYAPFVVDRRDLAHALGVCVIAIGGQVAPTVQVDDVARFRAKLEQCVKGAELEQMLDPRVDRGRGTGARIIDAGVVCEIGEVFNAARRRLADV
jgi:hypothetical protein